MAHKLIEELNTFKGEFRRKAERALKDEFKAYFAKHPTVGSVVWTQYTPYFNDGEACTFGINEIEFKPLTEDGKVDDDYEYGEGSLHRKLMNKERGEWHSLSRTHQGGKTLAPEEQAFVTDCKELSSLVHGLDDMMKDIFGDHAKVVAKPDGFDVEEYEHD